MKLIKAGGRILDAEEILAVFPEGTGARLFLKGGLKVDLPNVTVAQVETALEANGIVVA